MMGTATWTGGPMNRRLFLTVGLPGTGKTTAARRIEVEQEARRLTKDEWMKALYGSANPELPCSLRANES